MIVFSKLGWFSQLQYNHHHRQKLEVEEELVQNLVIQDLYHELLSDPLALYYRDRQLIIKLIISRIFNLCLELILITIMIINRRSIRTVIDIQDQILQDQDLQQKQDLYQNPPNISNNKNDPAMQWNNLLLHLKLKFILPPK